MHPTILRLFMGILATASMSVFSTQAQVYVTDAVAGTINVYHTNGAPLSLGLISGLSGPTRLVVDGSFVYVLEQIGNVKKYSTSGAPINPALFSVFGNAYGIALCGGFLYVASTGDVGQYSTAGVTQNATFLQFVSALHLGSNGDDLYVPEISGNKVGKYTVPGGVLMAFNPSLISVPSPGGVAVSGGYIYVSEYYNGVINKYTTAGALVQASFITGLSSPGDIAVVDGALYVNNEGTSKVGKYNVATGATINAALISGPSGSIGGLAVVSETASVTIKGKTKIKTTAATRVVRGTSIAAAKVEVRVGAARFKKAAGTDTWTFTAKLKLGKNRISVRATGVNDIASPPAKITIIRAASR